ncbi:peptidoglycan-binding protein [Glycocaulis abyssi]|uniref:Peptidoglycan-binding protein n=1 Tax=Glycocaulis abyssi TaxID=1433403 RepID=A0ABV9NEX6_9PROT
MSREGDSRYSRRQDDPVSPMVVLLSVVVLLVIVVIAGYVMWPCSDRPGSFKQCQIDRFLLGTAVEDACRREGQFTQFGDLQHSAFSADPIQIPSRYAGSHNRFASHRTPGPEVLGRLPSYGRSVGSLRQRERATINCACVRDQLISLGGRGGLSPEAELIIYRLLEVERRPLSLTNLMQFLPPRDTARVQQAIYNPSPGGCREPVTPLGGTYPPRPWYVRWDMCGFEDGDPHRPRAALYVDVSRDYYECMSRENAARLYAEGARYWLLLGDAELARTDIQCVWDSEYDGFCPGGFRDGYTYLRHNDYEPVQTALDLAMQNWRRASDWGRHFGAQASLMAQRRLQAHTVQCQSSPDGSSLRRISRFGPDGVGEVIRLSLRQRALTSLGYHSGPVDGYYGPETREAVRGFQRELGFDETGALTPRQTTLLICHAAQTAREASVQNTLGIMYATGLGVEQNTDLALEWLETAARRNDEDAYFNLAIIYGTGAVLGSYRLCGIIENFERAESYLAEAARLGHPVARRWRSSPEYNRLPSPRARWETIAERIRSAAIEGGGLFYLEWEDRHVRLPDIDLLPPGCLDAERFQGR